LYAAGHLAAYKKPRRVVFMTEVPKNLTGRVVKTQLVERVLALSDPQAAPKDTA
jgi:non-ribosomal peptide synthetase component E (peptide arylation enzyme)